MFTFNVSPYWKSVAAAVGALAITAQTVVDDGAVESSEWGVILTAVAAAVAVFFKRNEPAA